MSNQKETRGGKRNNAGRKPLDKGEKKITLTIYPKEKYIDSCGGIDKAKDIALKAVEQ